MFKICYFVPESHLEATKRALFAAGAGKMGLYEQCCWQVKGQGQFLPLEGSQPALGEVQALARVDEYKVELVCASDRLAAAVKALRAAHPYEEPALEIIRLEPLP